MKRLSDRIASYSRDYLPDYARSREPVIIAPRCYETHPPLPIGEFVIYGGSCIKPIITDADVYVGFDRGMKLDVPQSLPWNPGEAFLFQIPDMGVPGSVDDAIKLVDYLAMNLSSKRKVHVGCIGGHGRTGMILAALVKVMTGEKDAISYVRKHYCVKAVESKPQVQWLAKHFGIAEVKGHKEVDPGTQNLLKQPPEIIWPKRTGGLPSVTVKRDSALSIWGRNVI